MVISRSLSAVHNEAGVAVAEQQHERGVGQNKNHHWLQFKAGRHHQGRHGESKVNGPAVHCTLHRSFTIQPLLFRDKLTGMGVGSHLVAWIVDYLTGRHVRLGNCRSETVVSSTRAPQGTVLSRVLFTLHMLDF